MSNDDTAEEAEKRALHGFIISKGNGELFVLYKVYQERREREFCCLRVRKPTRDKGGKNCIFATFSDILRSITVYR